MMHIAAVKTSTPLVLSLWMLDVGGRLRGHDGCGASKMTLPDWDIRNEGRSWVADEAWERFELMPEKIEMVGGKLLSHDEDRELLLGLLLENLGAERAVRLGSPDVWREAVARLKG